MIRFGRLNLALALVLLLPAVAAAQKDTKYTKEATKYLGIAMTRQDDASRTKAYEDALVHLRQGMVEDAQNAKVWMLAGQVLSALGQLEEANDAFNKAQQMHPAYAEEIEGEREAAWIDAFNRGAQAMDAGDYPTAIRELERAQLMYAQRPEALMNLGALYANTNELDKAEKAFEDAIKAANGPLFEKLDEEAKASWVRFRDMARLNVAQMKGARGVQAFEREDFMAAAEEFKKATDMNPHSRDYWFNLGQAYWAQTTSIEEKLEGLAAPQQAEAKQELTKLYQEVIRLTQKTREMDPANELLFAIEGRSERMIGEYSGNADQAKAGQDRALKVFETADALPVDVSEVMAESQEGTVTIRGKVKNRKLAEGSTVTVHFTLVGLDGKVLAERDVPVTVGAADSTKDFQATAEIAADLAGWKYSIRS